MSMMLSYNSHLTNSQMFHEIELSIGLVQYQIDHMQLDHSGMVAYILQKNRQPMQA